MTYSIRIKASATTALARVPPPARTRIIEAIDRLATEPTAGSALKGEFSGLRRLRIGDYRVVYEVIDRKLVVLVIRIAHRREAYRQRRSALQVRGHAVNRSQDLAMLFFDDVIPLRLPPTMSIGVGWDYQCADLSTRPEADRRRSGKR